MLPWNTANAFDLGKVALIESLPTTLLLAAMVAVLLALYRHHGQTHSSPVIGPEPGELSQGISLLIIACVTASAGATLVIFGIMGGQYPIMESVQDQSAIKGSFVATLLAYILSCAATGFYEEGLFRVLLQGLFERGFYSNGVCPRRCMLFAALLASLIFAVLHAVCPPAPEADTMQVALQALFKCVQGFLFGIVMVGLLKRTGSFVLVIAIHTCYNLLFFVPWFITVGAFPTTYLTGSIVDTVGLIATSACLVPIAALALRFLAYGGSVQRRAD